MESYLRELDVFEYVNKSALLSFKGKITKIKEIVPNTFEYDLELDQEMEFVAGQYLWVELENLIEEDPRGNLRAFSIISRENNKKNISIVFRKSDSGYKKTLLSLKVDDELSIFGPRGFFILPEVMVPTVLIAGGVGIAPFISMLRESANTNNQRKFLLFVNNASNDRRVYSDEIQEMVKSNPNHRVYELIGEKLNWGFIEKNLEEFDISINDALWYLSGPEDMIDSVYSILEKQNINPDKIQMDEFKAHKQIFIDRINLLNEQNDKSLFKLAADMFSSHIALTDTEGRILYANAAAEKATGFKLKEMLGYTPRLWGGLMTKEFYIEMWNTIKNDKKSFTSEIVNRRKNGEIYIARVNISPLSEDGKLIGYIATEFEITDIVKRNSQLSEKISEYEKLNKLMVDREIRMMELKKEIDQLKQK